MGLGTNSPRFQGKRPLSMTNPWNASETSVPDFRLISVHLTTAS